MQAILTGFSRQFFPTLGLFAHLYLFPYAT